jgi:hypothetical protein
VDLYAAHGDRLGVLRGHTAQAFVKLLEHGDKEAISILRDALEEVADLPSAPEIVEAQSELARALMLQGSPEALAWSDRVLDNPRVVNQRVLMNTLITRGSILLYMGRITEAEVVLRGSIVLADRLGDPMAMLRARNNIAGAIEAQSVPAVLELAREVFEIAERFGDRSWIQQAIGLGLLAGMESGRWDEWLPEAEAELPEAADFYRRWMETEQARRMAFRGRTGEALRLVEEALADPAIRGSAQAMASTAGLEAEIGMTQGRWLEAFEASRRGWTFADSARMTTQLAQFAAAAAGDAARLAEAVEAQAKNVTDDSRISQAAGLIGATLTALIAGRWDEARLAYLQARRSLEDLGSALQLAFLNLAVGHLGADRFAEAADAARAAEEFFSSRGADAFVATYRANAIRPALSGTSASPRAADAPVTEAEPSSR